MKKVTEKAGLLGQRIIRRGILPKGDPMLVVAIISVIVGMARMFLECKRTYWATPRQAVEKGRPIYQRWAECEARKSLFQNNYPESAAEAIAEEFFAEFDRMSDSEVQKVIEEVES